MTINWSGCCFGSFETMEEAMEVLKRKGWVMSKPPKSLYFVLDDDITNVAVIVMDDGLELKDIFALPSSGR